LKWFFCFSKNRRLGIQEILIVAVLGRLRFLMDMVSDTLVVTPILCKHKIWMQTICKEHIEQIVKEKYHT
jgi:hypothetical protein